MDGSDRRAEGPPLEAFEVLTDPDVPYTPQLAVDVFYPEADGPWPVAVLLHGGEDHKAAMSSFGRVATERGLVTFVPERRPFPARLEEHHLAAMENVACVIRFARDRAADYGGSGERIVMAGWSLDGNFAAIAALREASVEVDCIADADASDRVVGVVGLDGAYDFAEIIMGDPDARHLSWTIEEVNEISAHTYVPATKGDHPLVFRLFSGKEEQLHAQAERFQYDLLRAGFDVELLRHPQLSHEEVIFVPGAVDAVVHLAFGEGIPSTT